MQIKNFLNRSFIKTNNKRIIFFLTIDALLIALSIYISFLLRFEGRIPLKYLENFWILILMAFGVKVSIFYLQRLYHISWSYASVRELLLVFKGVFYSSLLLGTILFILKVTPLFAGFPRSILFIDFFLTLILIGGFRLAKRLYLQLIKRPSAEGRRTLIIGAGDAGEQLVRSIFGSGDTKHFLVGFVDDNRSKQGITIQGVKVLGTRGDILDIAETYNVEELIIAMPSIPSPIIRETVEFGRKAGIKNIKILPHLSELISGKVGLPDVREINLEDLLGRKKIEINTKELENYIKKRIILITGAAGSIGSELCRQVAKFKPKKLLIIDQDETELFKIDNELKGDFPKLKRLAILADVKNEEKMEFIFSQQKPEVVFHAAAYKHVGMLEEHPDEAIRNNVFGTLAVAKASIDSEVEKFVFISTDKAVNPISTMGASKRLSEFLIQELNQKNMTQFLSVRFGNVLGSRGSVVPIFQEQIKSGGPVTVTHPEAKRYFMLISEAALLVMQAGALSKDGEVFILDMGEPVKIMDLAKEMIKIFGYEPDKDIPIVITSLKEGEKLFEDLLTAEEGTDATKYKQIFRARGHPLLNGRELWEYLGKLKKLANQEDMNGIKKVLSEIFPSYKNRLSKKGAS